MLFVCACVWCLRKLHHENGTGERKIYMEHDLNKLMPCKCFRFKPLLEAEFYLEIFVYNYTLFQQNTHIYHNIKNINYRN